MDRKEADQLRIRNLRRRRQSNALIRNNTLWAAGTGLIPIPVIDSAATVAVQIKMLAEISSIYDVPFQETSGRSVIASLMSSLTSNVLGKSLIASGLFSGLAKVVPVVGSTLGILTMPGFNAAFTYALGRVFQQHYEAGGTLKDFDANAAKPYFEEKFKEGFKAGAKTQSPKSA